MKLFSELKRRNVFRVGLLYIVVAWLVIQVAETVLPMFDVPDGVLRGLVIVLALGFVPAIVFAWVFEWTPEGIRREAEVDVPEGIKQRSAHKLNWATLIVALLAIGLLVADRMLPEAAAPEATSTPAGESGLASDTEPVLENAATANDPASIAVLPFSDLSPDGDQEYFSDGISEEILNVLAGIEGLRVASRTSSFVFKGERKSIPLIAEELNVAHVLEGSVRKAGERIRITAQLIRADDDAHLWSENYDRELSTENLFAIQDEIARAIVSALRETLDTEIAGSAAVSARTDDLDAYELYLRAVNARSIMSTESARSRVELLLQAVEIDPDFADAWAELASDLVGLPTWDHHLDPDPYLQRGIEAAERSLALDPGNLRAYQALRNAWFYLEQWEQADDVLQRARSASVDLKPSSLELMELGYLEQAIQRAEEELKTQPDNNLAQLMIALALEAMGDYEQAMAQFETAILAGYHGGAEYNIAAIQQLQGRNRMRTVSLARDWEERDPELLPLLPHVIRLLAASDAEVGAEADRLVRIAQQMGFELEDLVAPGPRWGFRMPYAVVAALGHSDRVVDLLWTNEPKFWMWGTDFRRVRQSEAWRERVRDTGLLAYWQKHGWPEKCRPVGDNDFSCD